ncbi:MAG: hypothetical protein ACRC6T_10395 [Sarcina sp.]
MNKEKITKFVSNPFTVTFLIVSVIFIAIIFNILNTPKTFDNITKIVAEINFVNQKKSNIKEPTSSDFISEFTKSVSDLKGIKSDLIALEVSSDFTQHKKSLLNIIDKNINFYDKMTYFLKNIESESVLENSNAVLMSKAEFEKSLIEGKELKLPLTLDITDENLLSKATSYLNEMIKINRDKNIHTSQTTTFKTTIDLLYTKFTPLNEDLFTIIKLVKEDGRNLDSVLVNINEKIESFNNLNIELHSMSIPDGYNDLFLALKSVFKKYDIYIHSIRDYVIHEINNSANETYFKDAQDTYKDLNGSIIEYLKIANKFK